MRDPNRIDSVIETVKEEWKKEPDWRLGQLIVNISRAAGYGDPFFMEDDVLMKVIKGEADQPEDQPEDQPGQEDC